MVEDATAPRLVLVAGFGGALGSGLREVIDRDRSLRVLRSERDADLHALIARHRPAALLLNQAAVTSVMDLRRLVVTYPAMGVVVGVMRLNRERDESLLAAGARIVVPITVRATELCVALRLVAQGLVGPPRVTRGPTDAVDRLTERERQVHELLVRRRSAREIAAELHVTTATVSTHTRRIYEKLGVHSRAELAARAARGAAREDAREPEAAPLLSRDRVPFGRRSRGEMTSDRPSALDMRAALGVARWPR